DVLNDLAPDLIDIGQLAAVRIYLPVVRVPHSGDIASVADGRRELPRVERGPVHVGEGLDLRLPQLGPVIKVGLGDDLVDVVVVELVELLEIVLREHHHLVRGDLLEEAGLRLVEEVADRLAVHLEGARRIRLSDVREQRVDAARIQTFIGVDVLEAETEVLAGQRRTVRPLDAFAKRELDPTSTIQLLEGLAEVRDDFAGARLTGPVRDPADKGLVSDALRQPAAVLFGDHGRAPRAAVLADLGVR